MLFKEINSSNIDMDNSKHFVETIYNNFLHLTKKPNLNHNHTEINRLLSSKNMYGFLVYNENKLIGYLLGENLDVNNRSTYYINYLFVATKYRKNGLASQLLSHVTQYSKSTNKNCVMLTCDTQNKQVHNFYLKRGFMPDPELRNYKRHDILSLFI
jgi:RimJ/RimL family protein N-acetyltransferase